MIKRLIVSIFLLLPMMLQADDEPKNKYLGFLNASIALTADDNIAAGKYQNKQTDTSLFLFQLPGSYQFDPFGDGFNIYINGSYGYSKDDVPTTGYALEMSMLKGGIGLRYSYDPYKFIDIGYALIYSRSTYDVSNPEFKKYLRSLSPRYIWSNEYSATIKFGEPINGFIPYGSINFNAYETYLHFSFQTSIKEITKVSNTASQMLFTQLGCFTPALAHAYDHSLELEGFVGRTFFYGDIHYAIKGNYYDVYGAVLHFPYKGKWSEYYSGFEISYERTEGESFFGNSIGIGLNATF